MTRSRKIAAGRRTLNKREPKAPNWISGEIRRMNPFLGVRKATRKRRK